MIIVAIVGLIGTIGAAKIANWDKIFPAGQPQSFAPPLVQPAPMDDRPFPATFLECVVICDRNHPLPEDVPGHAACNQRCGEMFPP